jgi:hypothetical protein
LLNVLLQIANKLGFQKKKNLRVEKKAKQETKQAADRTLLATSEYTALKPPR